MAVFFNGARCGASAPDHMHFQAGDATEWPIFTDYRKSRDFGNDVAEITYCDNIGRRVYKIIAHNAEEARQGVIAILNAANAGDDMVNIIARSTENEVEMYVVPRRAFRPWQYNAEADKRLLISPASVEVGGVFIVALKEHFDKLQANDITDILKQVCF